MQRGFNRFWGAIAGALVIVTGAGCASDEGNGENDAQAGAGGALTAGTGGAAGASAGVGGSTGGGDAGSGEAGSGAGAGIAGAGMAGSGVAGAGEAGSGGMGEAGAGGMGGTGDAGNGGSGGTGGMSSTGGCAAPPPGTFDVETLTGGPGGNYTIVRPTTLGEGGFLHPPVAWGNGLATTPDLYAELLENVASHGFVVIGNPGTGSNPQVVRDGLEWLIEQNGSGEYAGKLAVDCAGTIGYSMGGGAAVGSGSHPAVKAIVSIHGLQDRAEAASGPILLTTSDDDGFVTKEGFAQPCYDRSSVQPTILATHITGNTPSFNGHLEPLGNGGEDAGPAIAWLRYWLYGDQSQREWFFGDDCTVCTSPWADVQRKNHDWN